jgi:hypothetical protein
MTNAPELDAIKRNSVQILPDAQRGGSGESVFFWEATRGAILPAWGTRERERALRAWYRNEYNTLVQGAFSGLGKRWSATPWEISGPKRATQKFQDVFRQADFGRGWSSFVQKLALDFLRQDGGAYVEVIAPGNPLKAPTGPAIALANLDSLRCLPTGDPEYPVIYYNRQGAMHLLHRTRVIHMVDMPDADERNPGYGLSALSRSIAVVQRQLLMGRFIQQRLDDVPLPGVTVASGITEAQLSNVFAKYRREQAADMSGPFGRTMWLNSLQPEIPVSITSIPFSAPPEGFDYPTYVEIDVNELALAIGVDKQELWELGSGDLGSGAQSEVLHAKSQGKMFGAFLIELERWLNDVLPESCEFAFKVQDPYEAAERANAAQVWASVVAALGDKLTADEARLLLANQIEAVKDAITDADGELVRLNDADPKAEPQAPQIVAPDASPIDAAPAAAPVDQTTGDSQKAVGRKAIQATALSFTSDFEDLLKGARSDDFGRRRFGIVLRDLIRKYGREAYLDGMADGGVDTGRELADDDLTAYRALLVKQSAFVTSLGAAIYRADSVTDGMAANKPEMWFNKSILPFFEEGRASADANGTYEFAGDDGAESCVTCQRLKGQRHRMKDWTRKALRPRVDTAAFDCGGWMCQHVLVKTTERARGKW